MLADSSKTRAPRRRSSWPHELCEDEIEDAKDVAPGHGLESSESRFFRSTLGAEGIGMANYKVKPDARFEFGHRHKSMEEVYVVVSGSGRFRIGEEIVEVGARDVVYVEPQEWRGWEAGPDGMELLAFGSHVEGDDESEMDMEFWPK